MIHNLLQDKTFIKWCFGPITKNSLVNTSNKDLLGEASVEEREWGNTILNKTEKVKQWTTVLCQEAVREALILLGYKDVLNARLIKSSVREKEYAPDLETDEFVWEVKGRSWCTTGTAGEKILGTPIKYSEVPQLYGKPLRIVLLGYQEYEAKYDFACGDIVHSSGGRTKQLDNILAFYKQNEVEYVAFTDLLKELMRQGKIPKYPV